MRKVVIGVMACFALSSVAFARVDINTATESELEALKGIGPVRAQAIIEYRQKHGAFKSLKELEMVPGVATTTVEKIKDEVTIDGRSAGAKGLRKSSEASSATLQRDPRN